mgnify:CR=1 FL=1
MITQGTSDVTELTEKEDLLHYHLHCLNMVKYYQDIVQELDERLKELEEEEAVLSQIMNPDDITDYPY